MRLLRASDSQAEPVRKLPIDMTQPNDDPACAPHAGKAQVGSNGEKAPSMLSTACRQHAFQSLPMGICWTGLASAGPALACNINVQGPFPSTNEIPHGIFDIGQFAFASTRTSNI